MPANLEDQAKELRRQRFAPVSLAGLSTATYEPPAFLVEGLIPAGHVTLLGGHGGAGKSMLALVIAAHCAAGRDWAGLSVKRAYSVFVSLEDSGDLVRYRLKRVVEDYGLEPAHVESTLLILDGTQGDAALAVEVNDVGTRRIVPTASMDELRELVRGAGLIVVDNASDAFDGDENNRRQVRAFIRMLAQIAHAEGAAVLLLAHIDKNAAKNGSQGNSYSGSTAWHNSARSRLALLQSKRGVELRQEKLNLGPKAAAIELDWSDGGVLVPSTVSDTAREVRRTAAAAEDDAKVLKAIEAAIESGHDVTTARTGPVNTYGLLRNYPELGSSFREREGKERFWFSMSRLQKAGEIVSETYKNAYRKDRARWVRPGADQIS